MINYMELEQAIAKYLEDIIRPIVESVIEDALEEAFKKALDVYHKDDLITVKEACKLLRCSEPTFYYHVNVGNIKLVKNGRSSLVHRNKLLEDLDSGKLRLRADKHRR